MCASIAALSPETNGTVYVNYAGFFLKCSPIVNSMIFPLTVYELNLTFCRPWS